MKYDTQTPFVASYVIVKNEEGKIAFVLRANTSWMNNYYGLPSGKVEQNESFISGAIREAKEEIGIDVKAADLEHAITVHRGPAEKDNDGTLWVDVYFEVKQWQGEVYNAEPHMHKEVAWLDPANLPDTVIPSVKASIEAWLSGKMYFEYGW